jgi:hypothetical protein
LFSAFAQDLKQRNIHPYALSGVSQYVMDDNGKKTDDLIFNSVMQPGKLIYWNDKRVWHYGTDIKVADANAMVAEAQEILLL